MKRNFTLIAVVFHFMLISAQELHSIGDDIPNEEIYAHINTSMPFVGEYLYFKVYCLHADDKKLSDISKIAYLDLVNQNKEVIHSQSIDVERGMGYGDYFIPTNIASGNYKLLAYTRWGENNVIHKFFAQDIFIINPYTSQQTNIRKDSVLYKKAFIDPSRGSENLKIDKTSFQNREKVEVQLSDIPKGKYSVSVRQFDSIPHPDILTANTVTKSSSYTYSNSGNYFLPDLRGKLIEGHISSNKEKKLQDVKLSLTVPGKDFFLRIAKTDKHGKFYFSVDENFVAKEAIIQIMDDEANQYNINLDSVPKPDLRDLSFGSFGIDSLARKMIENRSIHNQIENAYFSFKPDTIRVSHLKNLFDGTDKLVYNLDDYTRFKTVKETFVEIIRFARVRKVNGNYEFGVFGRPPNENYQGQPLVIVDGLPLIDTDGFIRNYESTRIEKIEIIQDNYYLGASVFKGVILIETINGDFADNYHKDYLKRVKLTSGNLHKDYFQQDYEVTENSHLPDFRTQLLWLPDVPNNTFHFFTSDVDGIFEISVQGFTNEGKPVSLKRSFKVK